MIIHDTWYGGAPAGIQALTLYKEVFEERGIDFTPGPTSTMRPAPPTEAEKELARITGEY